MNIHCVAQSSTFLFHQMQEASSKKSYMIVAIALAAISSLALMAVCYRQMKNKSIKSEKDDKQQSKLIHQVTPIPQKVKQPVAKPNALSPQKFAEKEDSPTPTKSGLSEAFPSPQGLRVQQRKVDSPETYQDTAEVVQLKNLLVELSSFIDHQNPKTPSNNELGEMQEHLEQMSRAESFIENALKEIAYNINELSAWQTDHKYIIKHDATNALAIDLLGFDEAISAPQLLDLIPSEISESYDHENILIEKEAMVTAAIEYYKEIQEQHNLELPKIKQQIEDLRNEMPLTENKARMECFALMRSISKQYGAQLAGLKIDAGGIHDNTRWEPASNKFFIAKGFAFEETDSPENLVDNRDNYDDPQIVFYKISRGILDSLIWNLHRAAEDRLYNLVAEERI